MPRPKRSATAPQQPGPEFGSQESEPGTPATPYPPCDPSSICPTVSYGGRTVPDMANHRASRVVTREEALAHEWSMFWTGQPCRYGHAAARWVSNTHLCSDCKRLKDGKTEVYSKAPKGSHYPTPRRKPKDPNAPIVIAAPAPAAPLQPDARDTKFLEAYAEHRSITLAAAAVGTTPAFVETRRACNQTFATAITKLEEQLSIPRAVLPLPTEFAWTPEIERHLIRLWVDCGELQTARDCIGVTASQYFEHLEESAAFTEAIQNAAPLAAAALEDKAHQLALKGNDRLLQKLLEAKKPDEYGNRVRVDFNDTSKMTDAQIDARLVSIFRSLKQMSGQTVDMEVVVLEPTQPAQLSAPESTADETEEETAISDNEDLK